MKDAHKTPMTLSQKLLNVAIWIILVATCLGLGFLLETAAQGQQTIAPFYTNQANTNLYVKMGQGSPYSTIHLATVKACTSAASFTVILLPGANPADTISGQTGVCSGATLIDYTAAPAVTYKGNGTGYVAQGSGGGGPPTGAAGGDLNGSNYPNPIVSGLKNVPFCNGFTPTNGQAITLTTSSAPNPCWTALTPSGGGGSAGTQGQVQAAGSTPGSFQITSCTDNGTTYACAEQVTAPSFVSGTPSTGAKAALPAGAHGVAGDESATASVGAASVDSIRFDSTLGVVKRVKTGPEQAVPGVNSGVSGNCVEFATNGIDLTSAGVSCTGGFTARIKYVSQLGCAAQNTDLNLGGGTDDTACINAALAAATSSNPVLLWQDGKSLISGAGVIGPAGGNWGITGNGGGLTQIAITACSITGGNLATFTTTANTLVAGEGVTVKNLTNCSALNGATLVVLGAGLTSTQFEATVSASNVSSASENGTGVSLFGTGFYLAPGSEDAISNGHPFSGTDCEIVPALPPSRGANISMTNFVLNGNSPNQSVYCFGIDLHDINGITLSGLTIYNVHKFASKFANVGDVSVTDSVFQAANNVAGAPSNTDGIHMDGPWNDLKIANNTFRTSDDAIALNANEGYCGPGVRTEITNSTLDNSLDAIRAYNVGAVCSNGLTPVIDTVDISNFSGTVYNNLAFFGLGAGTVGALNPAVTNFHWDNSTVFFTGSTTGQNVLMNENLGAISFSNDTFGGITTGTAFIASSTSGSSTSIAQLSLDNVKFVRTTVGQGPSALLSGNNVTIGSLVATGLGIYDAPGSSFANMACLFCLSGSNLIIDNLYYGNLDTSKVTEITDPAQWGVSILASGNNDVYPPSGNYGLHGPWWDIRTYTNGGGSPGSGSTQSVLWEFDPTRANPTFGQQTFVGNLVTGAGYFGQNVVYDGTKYLYTMPPAGGSRGAVADTMIGSPSGGEYWQSLMGPGTGGTTITCKDTSCVGFFGINDGTHGPQYVYNPGGTSPTIHPTEVLGANATSSWWIGNDGGNNSAYSINTVYTVGALPSAATLGAGAMVTVSDATTFTPGTCTGGGSDYMIAVSNGSAWSCH